MGKLRPEDLVKKPTGATKSEGEKEQKKIPPKLILIGGGIAVLVLCVFMMSSSPKKPPQTAEAKHAAIEKGKAEIAAVQEKKTPSKADVAPGAAMPQADNNAQIDGEIAKADATLKSIVQHVASIDAELREYNLASERLGQVGDREGKRDADRHVVALTQKRKEAEASHAKWVAYREDLQGQKTSVAGVK